MMFRNVSTTGIDLRHPLKDLFLNCYCSFVFADLNECLTDGICGYGAQCINVKGSYKCQCPDGYKFDKKLNFCEGDKRESFQFIVHLAISIDVNIYDNSDYGGDIWSLIYCVIFSRGKII